MYDISGKYNGHFNENPNVEEYVEFILTDGGQVTGIIVSNNATEMTVLKGKLTKNVIKGVFEKDSETGEFEFKVFKKKKSTGIKMVGYFQKDTDKKEYTIIR